MPISNLFIQRQSLASIDDPEFKTVSDILVNKCADCHTRDMAQYPFYFSLPIAKDIMKRNIDRAQFSFLLDKDKLSGKKQFNSFDVQKLTAAMAKGNMPPLQYVCMHWTSALSDQEKMQLVGWIQNRSREYDIRPIPAENFFKPDAKKVALGQRIFNEPGISGNDKLSCASCHNVSAGGSSKLANNTQSASGNNSEITVYDPPTVLNAAYNFAQYWDGRARSLSDQAAMAMENPQEMASSWGKVIGFLQFNPSYSDEFKKIYSDGISKQNVCDAISEYERSLLTPGSCFDKFLLGDKTALSAEEQEGLALFKKHQCASCHAGPALGGISYEFMGAEHYYFTDETKISKRDLGRFNATHNKRDKYRFKVPTLRNVELTAPYFHDGSAKTLEDAVEVMSRCQIVQPLNKSEVKKITTFLRSLTSLPANGKAQ